MWGTVPSRCPACGTVVAPDFVFCHGCGTPLRYMYVPAPQPAYPPTAYSVPLPPAPPPLRPGVRTRRGLGITAGALIAFGLPFLSVFGALLLSVGSTLLFVDRKPFKAAHGSAMNFSFALFWTSAVAYALVYGMYLVEAYDAFAAGLPPSGLRGPTEFFIVATTAPTAMLILAVGLQIQYLVPRKFRLQVPASVGLLLALAAVATYLAYVFVPVDLGTGGIHISTIAGILNDVSVYRLVEMPGFVWLAYLYFRAFGNVGLASPADIAPSAAGRQA